MKHATAYKRFGTRYGIRQKKRLEKIEPGKKGRHKCPYCNYITAQWVCVGIWHCSKCGSKFTDKAYLISKRKELSEEKLVSEEENGSS